MTKMKRYPRFLALLATLALLLNSVPLILQAAADNAAMTLRVLEDFTGLVPGGEVGKRDGDVVGPPDLQIAREFAHVTPPAAV